MSIPSKNAVRIAAPPAAGPLSKVRKQFNSLVKRLDAERARLALWREEVPKIRAMADNELGPLIHTFDEHRRTRIVLLDQAWHDKLMSKTDRKKLSDIIAANAEELLQEGEMDAVIRTLYDKHSGSDSERDLEAEKAVLLDIFGAETGLELDDDADLSTPESIIEAIRQKLEQHGQDESDEPDEPDEPPRPAKPSARDLRHQAEEIKLKHSVRDIFRKLASALHPDRETDPAEHARKTGLMQRANVAYAANDLLGLIELQFEVAQIDQAGLDRLDDDRIKQYNRILDNQYREVSNEIDAMEAALSHQMGWYFHKRPTPKAMLQFLHDDIAAVRGHIDHIVDDLAIFSNTKKLKAWLRDYEIPDRDDDMSWF